MKYKVSYEFRAKVTLEVEANSKDLAETDYKGLREAEEAAALNLSLESATARPA
jgi:hypothetical protein